MLSEKARFVECVEEVLSNIPLQLFIHLPHLSGSDHLDQPDTIYKLHTISTYFLHSFSFILISLYQFNRK